MKWFLILLPLLSMLNQTTTHLTDAELWEEAHKSLIRKTREYVKENPISNELREFIKRVRALNQSGEKGKVKRQDVNNMYVIKDGEVVPINESNQGEDQFSTESNLGANFTVVPLIIPVPLEHNVTLTEKPKEDKQEPEEEVSQKIHSAILGRGEAFKKGNNASKRKEGEKQKTCEPIEFDEEILYSSTEETLYTEELIEARLRSTTKASEMIKMLDDMEQLITNQKQGKPNREGFLCNINGYWDSEAGGKTIHILSNHSATDNQSSVVMFNREPAVEEGFLIHEKWNVTAQIPFPHTAEVILIATTWKAKKIAIFIGECRICEGSETITGDWMIGRTSTSCKDQKASHSFFSDVLRKNNVPALQNDHFKKINMTTPKPPEDNAKEKS